jgi:predicted nucleotidyltransferase
MKKGPKIQSLFYNHPTKQWHFEQVLKESKLSRAQTNKWLKKLQKQSIIKRVKPKKKMPFYISKFEHPHYKNSKLLYALNQLHQSGLLDYLNSIKNASTIILFGSFSRWDWYNQSDIDIFIYGHIDNIFIGKFSAKLQREIQIFTAKNNSDLKRMGPTLLQNIIQGIILKGTFPKELLKNAIV